MNLTYSKLVTWQERRVPLVHCISEAVERSSVYSYNFAGEQRAPSTRNGMAD